LRAIPQVTGFEVNVFLSARLFHEAGHFVFPDFLNLRRITPEGNLALRREAT